jgi:hypothetical protein
MVLKGRKGQNEHERNAELATSYLKWDLCVGRVRQGSTGGGRSVRVCVLVAGDGSE